MQPLASLVGPSTAESAMTCNDQFQNFHPRVISTLPEVFQERFQSLKPSERARFERRFQHRDRIRAHAEAARISARILQDYTNLPLNFLFKPEAERSQTITSVLQKRLDQEANRARIENTLLDLGYKRESDRQLGLSRFQSAHFRELESLKRFAVNSTTTIFMGLPVLMGRFQYQRFNLQTPASKDPLIRETLEKEISALQERVASQDPLFVKELKRELALELARRILVVGVFAIITNELLDFLFPTWVEMKSEFWNPTSEADRKGLEETAFNNWLELYETFSGEKLSPESPLSLEMKARISQVSLQTLKAHVHHGAPLPE